MKGDHHEWRELNIVTWSDTILPQCYKHLLNVSAMGLVSQTRPAPAGTLSFLSSLTQRRRQGWQWWCSRQSGSGLVSPHSSWTVPRTSPQSTFSRTLRPMRSSSKSGLMVKYTKGSHKLQVPHGTGVGAAVVWKPCPHHSFCFVFSPTSLCLLPFMNILKDSNPETILEILLSLS